MVNSQNPLRTRAQEVVSKFAFNDCMMIKEQRDDRRRAVGLQMARGKNAARGPGYRVRPPTHPPWQRTAETGNACGGA